MQIICGILCLLIVVGMAAIIFLWRTARQLLKAMPPRQYYENAIKRPLYVLLKDIPPEVLKVFIGCEDPMFYRHRGILPMGMIRAALYTIRSGRYYGGSTITQQLVKNVYLTRERTIRRKALEAIIALYIDWGAMLSKDEILELYLNLAEMGPKIFGIGAASEYHFGKRASRLTLNQAVILATTLPSPFWRRPVEAPLFFEKMRNRTLFILVSWNLMTVAEAEKILRRYSAEKGFDPELRSKQELQAYRQKHNI